MLRHGVVRGSPNPKYFGLGSRLGKALRQSGLTRRALARRAGVSNAIVGYLETSQRLPKVATVARLAAALHVTAAWLAYGLGEQSNDDPPATCCGMGARLQKARADRGLTKAAVARLVKLSASSFAKIEAGGQTGVDVLEALAEQLGVSPAWLAYDIGPQTLPPSRRGRPSAQSLYPSV